MAKQGRYESYRDSGTCYLGDVPSSWETKQLTKRSVEGCVNGVWGQEPTESSDNIVVIRVADFDRPRLGVSDVKFTMRDIPEKDRIRRRLRRGDLLLEKSGGGENQQVGQVVLFDMDIEAVTSNFVARLRPHGGVDSDYLNYAFSSLYRDRMNTCSIKQNTGIQNLDSSAYLAEQWAFPSHTEQRQIAAFLDYETAKIDALIEKQQQLIALLGEKRQAVISHAVTKGLNPDAPMRDSGVEWLGQVPTHWDVSKIKHLCYVNDGNHGEEYPKSDDYTDEDSGVPFIRGGNMQNFQITNEGMLYITQRKNDSMRKGRLQAGDVLFMNRGDIGKLALMSDDHVGSNLNSQIAYLRCEQENVSNRFLLYFLASDLLGSHVESLKMGSVLTQFPIANIVAIPVPLPDANEQQQIVTYIELRLEKVDDLVGKAEGSLELLQERRTALISAAVTGKIDVRGWKPPSSAAKSETEMEVA